MPGTSFLPTTEAGLLNFSQNFDEQINETPEAFGLTLALAAAYSTLYTNYATTYANANHPTTRTPASIAAKNDAKEALIENTRQLALIVQGTPGVTNEQRVALGLTVRDTSPTRIPRPSSMPVIEFESVNGNRVYIRVHDNESPGRAKPEGVTGVYTYTYVGENPPTQIGAWKFEGSTSKTELFIDFPASVEPGTKVWVTAAWANAKFEAGEATPAVFTYTNHGSVQQAA